MGNPLQPPQRSANGADILDSAMHFVRRFVVLSEAQARAVALWTCHTHAIGAAEFTSYLNINSAEKESGKTRLLDVLKVLVPNPWKTENASPAAMVRKIHKGFETSAPVTVLFDERDSQTGGDKERAEVIRGILNSGYERDGCYSRIVGEGANQRVVDFQTFGAKALAGIGSLTDTVASRSIPVRMKRARRGTVGRFRKRGKEGRRIVAQASELKTRLAAWGTDNLQALANAEPEVPEALSDRQADVCEPLLAIADLAGGDWPQAARNALVGLCGKVQIEDGSIGVKALNDIKRVFDPRAEDGKPLPEIRRIGSDDLATALAAMEGSPWMEWGKSSKPLSPTQLARLLAPYDIHPKTLRFPDEKRVKGYEREQFEEAWELYLSPSTPYSKRDSVTTRENTGENGDFQPVTATACHASENAVSANKDAPCHGVTAWEPGNGGEQGEPAPEPVFEEGEI